MKKPLFEKLKGDLQKEGYSPKGIVALIIFGAIAAVFVLFGYNGKHNTIGSGAAGQVNETLISVADLRNESERLQKMYAPMFGGQMGGDMQRQFIQQQALENLISQELLAQSAQKMGIKTTDAEIRELITKDIEAFQDGGKFQRDRYLAILQANRWTPGEFEQRIRKERSVTRLRRMMEVSASPLDLEVKKMKDLKETKVNIEFVRIEKTLVAEKAIIPDSEITQKLADAEFLKRVQADFDASKASYGSEEQVKASHILIKFNAGDAGSEQAALQKIQDIQKKTQKEDFGKLAAQYSEDTGSKASKGDLGFFERGRMVPEFEKVAFSSKPGVVSEPVKTQYGYHLIKVTEHKAANAPDFEKSKMKVAKKLMAGDRYESELKKLETLVESSDVAGIQGLVKAWGLAFDETGFFDLGQEVAPKLSSPVATKAALELNESAPMAKKLVRDSGAVFVLRWKASKKEPLPAGENLATNARQERAYEMLNDYLNQAKKSALIEKNQSARQ